MDQLNPNHPMSKFGSENAVKFIACMIWKLRAHCPNLAVEITAQDMAELANVFMRDGQRGMVACIGKKEAVVLQLVDQQTGQALIADPALDENSPNAKMMRNMLRARKRAPAVASKLLQFLNTTDLGINDIELVRDAAEILKLLTWDPQND